MANVCRNACVRRCWRVLCALVLLALLPAGGPTLSAAEPQASRCRIVDCGGDFGDGYYRGNQKQLRITGVDLDGDGSTTDDVISGWPFSLDDPLSPRFPEYDATLPSAVFYGGLAMWFRNNPNAQITEGHLNKNHELRDDFNLMSIRTNQSDATSRVAGVWFWRKESFLNGGDRCRVSFDEQSMIVPHVSRYWQNLDNGRWLVREGEQFYLSEATFSGLRKSHVLRPLQTRWAPYNPQAPFEIRFAAEGAQFAPREFRDVTAVGFYVARDQWAWASCALKWNAFECYAVVHRPAAPSYHLALQTAGQGWRTDGLLSYERWLPIYRWAASNQYCLDLEGRGYTFERDADMGRMDEELGEHGADEPATDMAWLDAVLWCNALSEYEGRMPAYYADPEYKTVLRIGMERTVAARYDWRPAVYWKRDAPGFRLPVRGECTPVPGYWQHCWGEDASAVLPEQQDWSWIMGQGEAPAPRPYLGAPSVGFAVCLGPVTAGQAALTAAKLARRQSQPAPERRPLPATLRFKDMPESGFRRDDEAGVRVSPCHVATTETSFRTWIEVLRWGEEHGYRFDADGDMGSMDYEPGRHRHGPDEPVTDIGWYDAVVWCNALSEMTGRRPCYYTDEARTQVLRRPLPWRVSMYQGKDPYSRGPGELRWAPVYGRWETDGFRLPTEAEWQCACAPPDPSVPLSGFPWDGGGGEAPKYGWMAANSGGTTHPVGQLPPNRLGLHDFCGNVSEWVWDWPKFDYYRSRDPKGGNDWDFFGKALRGDNFGTVKPLRAAQRQQELPGVPRPIYGFRVVYCDAGVHPEVETFAPPVVLDVKEADFDLQQGRVWRANLHRTGVFQTSGVKTLHGVRWSFPTGGKVRGSPVAVDGTVYCGSTDQKVYALAADSGKERWSFAAKAPILGSPAVVDGTVYIGSNDGVLYALEAATGKLRWQFRRPDQRSLGSSPAVAHGVVFCGFGVWGGGAVSGIAAATGKEVWRYRFMAGPSGQGAPIIDGVRLICPTPSILMYAADLRTEQTLWVAKPNAGAHVPAALADDKVFVAGNTLGAFDAKTGASLWLFKREHARPGLEEYQLSAPAVWNGMVYFGVDEHLLYAADAATGQERWRFATQGAVQSSPAVAAGLVSFGCADGKLYALDGQSGALVWQQTLGGPVNSSPWPGDGAIYVGCDDGRIYAIQ